jgi:hypothetical protein
MYACGAGALRRECVVHRKKQRRKNGWEGERKGK